MLEIKADLSTCSSTKTNDKSVCMYFMKQPQFYDKKWKIFMYLRIIIVQITKYKCILLEMSEAMLLTYLINFVTCLLTKSFETFSSVSMNISHDIRRKCATLAECLVSNCNNILTPFKVLLCRSFMLWVGVTSLQVFFGIG